MPKVPSLAQLVGGDGSHAYLSPHNVALQVF